MKSVTNMVLNNPAGGMKRLVIANDCDMSVRSKLFVKRSAVMEQQTLHSSIPLLKNRGRSGMNGPDTQEVYVLVITSRYFMMDENYSTGNGFTFFSAPG